MSQLILDAFRIALDAHGDQRYGNEPYIYHPLQVADEVAHLGENYIAAALLHDVIEDHPDFEPVVMSSMPMIVTNALVVLRRYVSQHYFDYILRIKKSKDPIALAVKRADLHANLSCAPRPGLINRYLVAQDLLRA